MPEKISGTLEDIGVLVTRPAHQAQSLAADIEAHGGHVILLPTIEIEPVDTAALRAVIDRLPEFDIAIFISVNAVEQGLLQIKKQGLSLPDNLVLACVGPASKRALEAQGYHVDVVPTEKFSSESLLARTELTNVSGKRVAIFRGQGGRELLADTLRERGAALEYAECYKRAQPQTDTRDVERGWSNGKIDLVVVTSGEGLQNLYNMMSHQGRKLLINTPVITVSERTLLAARSLGLKHVMVTMDASDQAIMDKLQTWRRKQKAL